jgi:hypothetical protein
MVLFVVEINRKFYEISKDGTARVSCNTNASGHIVIPEYIIFDRKKYKVTHIEPCAFYWCEGLISIILPPSITTIGNAAFCRCENLVTLTLPDA